MIKTAKRLNLLSVLFPVMLEVRPALDLPLDRVIAKSRNKKALKKAKLERQAARLSKAA